jgi:GAF domain-containing protein
MQKPTGLRPSDLVGRLASESLPGLDTWWLHAAQRVIESQQTEHIEHYVPLVDRWFEMTVFPFGPDRFAVLYYDTTDKKRRELDAAFLDCVNNELMTLSSPADILETIGAMVSEYLKVSSCSFAEIDDEKSEVTMLYRWANKDAPPLKQTFRLKDFVSDDFSHASRAGQVFVLYDTASDERAVAGAYARVGVGAVISVPYIRNERWIATASIANATARDWREEEIRLFQEISNRMFSRMERAKDEEALRRSEEKYRILFESIGEGFALMEMIYDDQGLPVDWWYLDANPAFEKQTGIDPVGRKASQLMPGVQEHRLRFFSDVAKTGRPARTEEHVSRNGRWYSIYASPVGDSGSLVSVIFDEITNRKLAEKALRDSEERKTFLLMLSDALRPLADPTAIQDTATRVAMDYFGADRCYYCEIEGNVSIIRREAAREGLASIAGIYPLDALPLLKTAITTGKPFVVPDVHTTDAMDETSRRLSIQLQIVSFFKVPVIKEGRPVGVLAAVQRTPREWTNFEIELAQEVAERTWAAVEGAKADQQLARELEDARQLQQISNRLIEEDDIQSVYEAILDSAMAIMHADFASIQSVTAEKNELFLLAYRNFHPASAEHWRMVEGGTTTSCAQAMKDLQRVMIHDVENSPFPLSKDDYDSYRMSGIVSMQTTPLFSRAGNHVGMLSTHWKSPHTPSPRELSLFDVLARQAADLIEQKRAQEVLNEKERSLKMLLDLKDEVIFSLEKEGYKNEFVLSRMRNKFK